MSDRRGVQRLTADEAAAALTAAAWTERISEERYEAAVEAALALTRDASGEDRHPERVIAVGDLRDAIRAALGVQRTLIHCMMGGLGADWDLDGAVAVARSDGAQCAWAPDLFRHELAVYVDGRMHRFDARRPAESEPAKTALEGP